MSNTLGRTTITVRLHPILASGVDRVVALSKAANAAWPRPQNHSVVPDTKQGFYERAIATYMSLLEQAAAQPPRATAETATTKTADWLPCTMQGFVAVAVVYFAALCLQQESDPQIAATLKQMAEFDAPCR